MSRPASLVTSTCTGHGVCVPGAVHGAYPCGTPCPGSTLPVATKNATCFWPPLITAPIAGVPRTVLVNGIVPLVDADVLVLHQSPCTNIIMVGPCGDASPKPIPCSCSVLAAEDAMGAGHPRIVKALTKTVLIGGLGFAAVGDPLGPPCLSTIASGSSNVFVGL